SGRGPCGWRRGKPRGKRPRLDTTREPAARLPLAPPPLAYADPIPRASAPVRKPLLPRRPADLDRDGREPGEARRLRELRELREGLENKLEELRDAHRRSAA